MNKVTIRRKDLTLTLQSYAHSSLTESISGLLFILLI